MTQEEANLYSEGETGEYFLAKVLTIIKELK